MIRRLLLVTTLPAVLSAQTVLESAGGIGRLDAAQSGGHAAYAASSRLRAGAFQLDVRGEAQDYAELGSLGRVDATLQWQRRLGDWRIATGPTVLAGNGIGEAWALALGAGARVTRQMGRVTVGLDGLLASASLLEQRTLVARGGTRLEISFGALRLGTSFDVTTVGDSILRSGVYFDPRLGGEQGTDTLFRRRLSRVEDMALHADWSGARLGLRGELGQRGGLNARTQTWWKLRAAYRILPTTALVLQTHRTPPDLLLGLRGGRATTVGLALTWPHGRDDEAPRSALETVRTNDRRVLLILELPAREQVLVTGEPTGWQAMPMERRPDGRWQRWLDVAPGTYRLNVALDGGAWVAPPGSTPVRDDFGGLVGLVTL